MAYKKLLPIHPLSIKVDKLMDFLEQNNLDINILPYGGVQFTDRDSNVSALYKDLDSNESMEDMPAQFEFKLILQED